MSEPVYSEFSEGAESRHERRSARRISKILVFEPNDGVCKAICDTLGRSEYDAIPCRTVEEAIHVLDEEADEQGRTHDIDDIKVLITCYSNPFNAQRIVQNLADNPRLPIILTTADEGTKKLFDNGEVRVPYLSIPFEAQQLMDRIAQVRDAPLASRAILLHSLRKLNMYLDRKPKLLLAVDDSNLDTTSTYKADAALFPKAIKENALVLLIQPNVEIRNLVAAGLREYGYRVEAPNIKPNQCVNVNDLVLIGDEYPDAAVIDLGMLFQAGGSELMSGLLAGNNFRKYGVPPVFTSPFTSVVRLCAEAGLPVIGGDRRLGVLAGEIQRVIGDKNRLARQACDGLESLLNSCGIVAESHPTALRILKGAPEVR